MNQFIYEDLGFAGIIKIKPFIIRDNRGRMEKFFSSEEYGKNGIGFVSCEETILESKKGVLRGIHYQREILQPRLIHLLYGVVLVTIIGIDKRESEYLKHKLVWLDKGDTIFVPGNCGLGTLAIEDSLMHIMYGKEFISEYDAGIRWDDEVLGIDWPINLIGGKPILSEKDRNLPGCSELE